MRLNLASLGSLCVLLAVTTACGDNLSQPDARGRDGDLPDDGALTDAAVPTVPTVTGTVPGPGPGASNVPRNTSVRITFSEPMDRSTLNTTSITLTSGTPPVEVEGTVITTSTTALFRPDMLLAANTSYDLTVTVDAKSAAQVALAAPHEFTFTTNAVVPVGGELPVDLGTAEDFVMLSKAGITTVPTSLIVGNLGISPIAATGFVGFEITPDATNVFATATGVTGRLYASTYAPPTPSNLTTAVSDMETAYIDAAGRTLIDAAKLNVLGGTINTATVLTPGVYRWGSNVSLNATVTLTGTSTDVWIFQISGDLTVAANQQVLLVGAEAKNVFWQVTGGVSAGAGSALKGVVLSATQTTLDTDATLLGRLFAQTAITVRSADVTQPAN